MDFSVFLKGFISDKEISNGKLAEQLNVPPATISHLLSGRNKPSLDFIQKLITAYPSLDLYEILNLSKYNNLKKEGRDPKTEEQADLFNSPANKNKKVKKVVLLYEDNTFEEYNY